MIVLWHTDILRPGGRQAPEIETGSGLVFNEFFKNERTAAQGDRRPRDRSVMIANEVQYRNTKAHLRQFEAALQNLEAASPEGTRGKLEQLEVDAVRAQADDLRAELEEYERLRSGEVSTFEASSLEDIATLLVKARLARGWSQRRLAERLGVAEQQIQRYESTGYRSASLARVVDVATTLGVTISERAELHRLDAA